MTAYVSPELERMAARCRLPICVGYCFEGPDIGETFYIHKVGDARLAQLRDTHTEATRAYVALRAELEKA